MSAEDRRRAAALMRGRAEVATPGPWWNESGIVHAPYPYGRGLGAGPACHPLTSLGGNGRDAEADGEHAASWHPAVALAAADLAECPCETHADAFARAYLGRDQ